MQNKYRGFTLIELLIVIIIIAILAAIAIPKYQDYAIRSKLAGEWVTLETLRTAVQAYRAECGTAPLEANSLWVGLDDPVLLNRLSVNLPLDKYRIYYATLPDIAYDPARDCTTNMNISADNMAFLISPFDQTQLPYACMSERGAKSYCISGLVWGAGAHANWVFEQ